MATKTITRKAATENQSHAIGTQDTGSTSVPTPSPRDRVGGRPRWLEQYRRTTFAYVLRDFEPFGVLVAIVALIIGIIQLQFERETQQEIRALFAGTQLEERIVRAPESVRGFAERITELGLGAENLSLRNADLIGANLRDANFSAADLRGADLSDSILTFANLGQAVLSNAILNGATLERAFLLRADLTGASLRDANLRELNAGELTLTDADLTDADLTDAYLAGSSFLRADLQRANLTGANLMDVTDLTQPQLDSACGTATPDNLPDNLEWTSGPCRS